MTTKEIISALRRGLFSNTLLQLAADTIEKLESENNSQNAEIARLTLDLKVIQHTATKYPHCVMRDNVAIFTKSPEDYDRWVSDITLEIFKFYAEGLKKPILSQLGISTMEKKEAYHFCIDEIDNLVKEMERSNELWKRRADNLLKERVGDTE